ncbi:putative mitochondrial Hypothetical protein [Leptomonas pyrrhocoris]|uniref:Uncharacterized protein n=1 Tax=Leptomonas pyrrhocoris TaxID=157538 RepID=A0A0M9FW58_LEPPY|nr:putative mitochondrial Hypothetical protein [Leptomonas pyrrhocoris]XP_015655760.1 putative mitochondrial Hypothetical protein [Leptomonas pyrrhocoris]KPA77320.1 putative mitochondrial Hypothetical protein [Leptomonas pyrrhocoris]KPA77321.1 putative mitochondrial Hypothetical protein [Leptomonas pyrrhocoris]|eukprot:XP_015655759.1 putative mitochondrial Hypothetical protein [Leptomonas pyrrhocoris]
MRPLGVRVVRSNAAPHVAFVARCSLADWCASRGCGYASCTFTSRRAYHPTRTLFAQVAADVDRAQKSSAAAVKTAAATQASASSSSNSSASSAHSKRAAQIRRNEGILRWLRRLVVPAFCLWGLFVLRPTEGHFLRYLAERRHLDADFNAWFPPVTMAAAANSAAPTDPASVRTDVSATFRTPQDRDWAAQKFRYKKGSDDEERVARRRLLFARERSYLADDTVVETIRSPAAQLEELQELRDHPPMHLLREQLDALVVESKDYTGKVGAAAAAAAGEEAAKARPPTPPQVLILFDDHRLFSTGAIVFRDKDSHVGRTMRFVGACGMLWRQIC